MSKEARWSTGKRTGRVIYVNNVVVGIMDSPGLALKAILAVNAEAGRDALQARCVALTEALEDAAKIADEHAEAEALSQDARLEARIIASRIRARAALNPEGAER